MGAAPSSPSGPQRLVGVVSTFPPAVCGIGAYADQQANALEASGTAVRRLDLARLQREGWTVGRSGTLRAFLRGARECDELVVHHQAWIVRDETRRSRVVKYLWPQLVMLWLLAWSGRRTTMVVHEYGYRLHRGPGAFLQWPLPALLFQLPRRLVFHTRREAEGFRRTFLRRRGVEVREHHADFRPRTTLTKAQARARLGIRPDAALVLLLGFFKAHKGFLPFARQVEALRAAGRLPPATRLEVVTSVQDPADAQAVAGLRELQEFAATTESVRVRTGFVDDEAFDVWLRAADVAALPYLATFSSGVAARARALGTPLLVRDVGGLAEQAGPGDAVYADDAGLEAGLRRLLASAAR